MKEVFDRETAVCFTGHRDLPTGAALDLLRRKVNFVLATSYSYGYRHYICGGAVGFDTLAAGCVISLRERLPDVKLHLVLPCRNQTLKWTDLNSLREYKKILGSADSVEYVTDFYKDGCMLERNRVMVDNSALCVAYCHRSRGGSAYTMNYAEKQGLGVINLAKDDNIVSEYTRFKNKTV